MRCTMLACTETHSTGAWHGVRFHLLQTGGWQSRCADRRRAARRWYRVSEFQKLDSDSRATCDEMSLGSIGPHRSWSKLRANNSQRNLVFMSDGFVVTT